MASVERDVDEGRRVMKKLYRFGWNCGRQGVVRGLFVADDANVKAALGREVHFGEILGKHSEICGMLKEEDLTALTDDIDFLAKFDEYDCASGYNPLDYISCPNCGDTLPAPYDACRHERCGWKRDDA